jgi:hypothetical protein
MAYRSVYKGYIKEARGETIWLEEAYGELWLYVEGPSSSSKYSKGRSSDYEYMIRMFNNY